MTWPIWLSVTGNMVFILRWGLGGCTHHPSCQLTRPEEVCTAFLVHTMITICRRLMNATLPGVSQGQCLSPGTFNKIWQALFEELYSWLCEMLSLFIELYLRYQMLPFFKKLCLWEYEILSCHKCFFWHLDFVISIFSSTVMLPLAQAIFSIESLCLHQGWPLLNCTP